MNFTLLNLSLTKTKNKHINWIDSRNSSEHDLTYFYFSSIDLVDTKATQLFNETAIISLQLLNINLTLAQVDIELSQLRHWCLLLVKTLFLQVLLVNAVDLFLGEVKWVYRLLFLWWFWFWCYLFLWLGWFGGGDTGAVPNLWNGGFLWLLFHHFNAAALLEKNSYDVIYLIGVSSFVKIKVYFKGLGSSYFLFWTILL